MQGWLDRHNAAIAAGVNVGDIARAKAQRFSLAIIRKDTYAIIHNSVYRAR